MKLINSLTLFFLIINLSIAQNLPSTNQWINFDKTYYKIKVAEDGIYRIDYATLTEQGFPADHSDAKQLSLIHQGEEVPLFVSDAENWGEGAYLEFYGKKLDGQFDKRLYENPDDQLHAYWSQFTDTAVYFLCIAESAGNIIEIENDLSNLPERDLYFNHTAVYYGSNGHSNGVAETQIQAVPLESYPGYTRTFNSHFASYEEGEGWVGNLYAANNPIASNFVTVPVNTPALFDDGTKANLTFKILGLSSDTAFVNDHQIQVHYNERLLSEDQFDGYAIREYSVEIPLSDMSSPETNLEFSAVSAASKDRQAVSYITINYPRSYDFKGIDHFSFTINQKEAGNYLAFENLDTEKIYWLYDFTHLIKIKLLYNAEKELHEAYLPAGNGEQRELVIQSEHLIKTVSIIEATNFTDYSNLQNQGNYIIITHPSLNKQDAINNYINYRFSNEGGSYIPVLVSIENLYDQYSYGIRKHPLAIKYFLNDAIENWERIPSHCFLLGKGIKNSKCRTGPVKNWNNNLVPSFGDPPNDQYFGAAGFNPLSRIAIGRLSADNEKDIQHYLDKVIAVEQAKAMDDCHYINEEQWKHQLLHLGGGNALEQATLFASRLKHQANIAENGMVTAESKYLFRNNEISESNACEFDEEYLGVVQAQECMNAVFKKGISIINFLGHASGLFWEFDIGEPEDYMYNQKYPVIISHSSFTGDVYKYFAEENSLSMPELWLNAKDAGAVAYIGFNHIFEMLYAADLIDNLYEQMFTLNPRLTLGEQVNATLLSYYNENDGITQHAANQLIFVGDPALKYAINSKPEVTITESDVSVTVNQINEFYYSVELVFDFNSLNIASVDSIPYNITLLAGDTETEVSSDWVKPGKQGFFKGEFTLLPNQAHLFRIQLDHLNQLDEICEDNNSHNFITGEWVIGIEDELLSNNTISNYPNPFNTNTTFTITLSQAVLLQDNYMTISNLNGKRVHQIQLEKGLAQQHLSWDGRDAIGNPLAAGVYWYQLKNEDQQMISLPQKVVLVK